MAAKKLKLAGVIKKIDAKTNGVELSIKDVQCEDEVFIALKRFAVKKKKDEETVAITVELVQEKLAGMEP